MFIGFFTQVFMVNIRGVPRLQERPENAASVLGNNKLGGYSMDLAHLMRLLQVAHPHGSYSMPSWMQYSS